MRKYTVQKAVNKRSPFPSHRWEDVQTFDTYDQARTWVVSQVGKGYDTEPSDDFDEAYFSRAGADTWDYRIV